jgi:hypothetical protein
MAFAAIATSSGGASSADFLMVGGGPSSTHCRTVVADNVAPVGT